MKVCEKFVNFRVKVFRNPARHYPSILIYTHLSASEAGSAQTSRDPMPVFMQEEVQSLLSKMTGFNILRVAGPQKVPLKKPRYKLLTDQELEEVGVDNKSDLGYKREVPGGAGIACW